MNAVKGAGRHSVGGIWFVIGLNKGAERMLEVDIVVQWKASDDGSWGKMG